jgi:hypothetical protein
LKRIYCEAGALTREIKKLGQSEGIALVHFPYDPGSHTRKHTDIAIPSSAKIQDLNLPINDLPGVIADYSGSVHFAEVLSILGKQNWRDVLHVDSALKQGCLAFVTPDKGDIIEHKAELERVLGIRFFHSSEWNNLEQFLASSGAASNNCPV